jgi:hypothetical protein
VSIKNADGRGAKHEFLKKPLVLLLQGLNPKDAACHRLFFTSKAQPHPIVERKSWYGI